MWNLVNFVQRTYLENQRPGISNPEILKCQDVSCAPYRLQPYQVEPKRMYAVSINACLCNPDGYSGCLEELPRKSLQNIQEDADGAIK